MPEHRAACPTVNNPLAGPEACTCPPPTPQLDRAQEVREVSEQIGDFVMWHLAERGYMLSRWMWEQLPCSERWGWDADHKLIRLSWLSGRGEDADVDPFDCPCGVVVAPHKDRPPNPYPHGKWSLVMFSRTDGWMREELARFFGIDYEELGREQGRLLDYLRVQHDTPRGAPRDEHAAAPGAP